MTVGQNKNPRDRLAGSTKLGDQKLTTAGEKYVFRACGKRLGAVHLKSWILTYC
jgi:hypothetical protein